MRVSFVSPSKLPLRDPQQQKSVLIWIVAFLLIQYNSVILVKGSRNSASSRQVGVNRFGNYRNHCITTGRNLSSQFAQTQQQSVLKLSSVLQLSTYQNFVQNQQSRDYNIIFKVNRGGSDTSSNDNENNSLTDTQQQPSSTTTSIPSSSEESVAQEESVINTPVGTTTEISVTSTSSSDIVESPTTATVEGINNTSTMVATSESTKADDGISIGQKIRQAIFPIYGRNEVTKFLLIGSIKFFIILALTLTRDCKDTLVVTQSGAEAIAFLKIYGVLPAATLYITMYSKLSDIVQSKSSLFYLTCIPFFIFFAIFDWFIFPNANILHPSLATVQRYIPGSSVDGSGMGILANIITHWTSAVFYVIAEIYSSVSVGLMFWQYANDVVSVDQAKRFYPLFAQMSGIAPVLAGQYVVKYASVAPNFEQSLHRLTNAVSFAGVMICYFYYTSRKFLDRTEAAGGDVNTPAKKTKKKKAKMTMLESAKFLASSQYLRLVATLVIGYGLSINFTEILWKSLVKKQYPDPLQYQRYMGQFSSVVGLSTCIVIFFGVHVIRILGWRIGAMATPAVMAAVSLPFFLCVLWPGSSIDTNPVRLQTAVIFGTLNSLLSKTSKYALFDPTTQMAYIPLDEDSKVKGKAAIDVLGSRIGKSGGSFLQQGLVILFGTILQASPAVCVLYYAVLFAWMNAANKLSYLFAAQTAEQQHDLTLQEEQDKSTSAEVKKTQ